MKPNPIMFHVHTRWRSWMSLLCMFCSCLSVFFPLSFEIGCTLDIILTKAGHRAWSDSITQWVTLKISSFLTAACLFNLILNRRHRLCSAPKKIKQLLFFFFSPSEVTYSGVMVDRGKMVISQQSLFVYNTALLLANGWGLNQQNALRTIAAK